MSKKEFAHNYGLGYNQVDECDIYPSDKEHDRLSGVLDILKKYDIIKSFKEFAENINETSVGLNDLKNGRKKISVNHVKSINTKYPFINTDYIIFSEGKPFQDDFLIEVYDKDNTNHLMYCKINKEAMLQSKIDDKDIFTNTSIKKDTDQNIRKSNDLVQDLIDTKNELLKAKDEILKLQKELYDLKISNMK